MRLKIKQGQKSFRKAAVLVDAKENSSSNHSLTMTAVDNRSDNYLSGHYQQGCQVDSRVFIRLHLKSLPVPSYSL